MKLSTPPRNATLAPAAVRDLCIVVQDGMVAHLVERNAPEGPATALRVVVWDGDVRDWEPIEAVPIDALPSKLQGFVRRAFENADGERLLEGDAYEEMFLANGREGGMR